MPMLKMLEIPSKQLAVKFLANRNNLFKHVVFFRNMGDNFKNVKKLAAICVVKNS